MFLTRRGKPWSFDALKKRWWRVQKRTGIKACLYQYRHAFASRAINETNANPAHVAALLGHTDLTMLLKHYLESDPAALHRALAAINGTPPDAAQKTDPGPPDR
ncbi:MAG: hypothetical protein L0Z62_09415 [Gemmataceae bacterium]|nr:hypothetical protein [Gemmataceae bacterium]